ncbi:MAG: ATP-binding protein [Syntrophorhabdales bacterium]|jgi:heavy metal sensor kinase
MRHRSVRIRLTLWYTSLLGVTFVILGLIAYVLVSYTLHKQTDSALRSVATALAESHAAETSRYFPPEVDEIFRRFFGSPPLGPYFEWLIPEKDLGKEQGEPNAPPFTRQARLNAERGLATFETFKGIEPYAVRVLTWPVVSSGRVVAVVRVGMSEAALDRTMSSFLLIMAALFPLALALAGGGGWFLAHRALRPVDRMTQAARQIGASQLHARIELTGANDELDRLAETLNEMLTRLEAAFTEMRQFTADASHELQTPLTILRGEVEIALRAERSPEEYVRVMKSALEEIERISLLVEGLLLLARSDAGVLKMDLKPLDPMALVEDVLGRLGPLARARSVALSLGSMEPMEMRGDLVHLRRLLFNLVDNAIKYTPEGGTVRVSVERRGEWAMLAVEDTGIGVAHEEQHKVFQRFYRSAEARSGAEGGSGLGLAIVKSIAEAHGGRAEVESAPGRGSTFKVYLPLA